MICANQHPIDDVCTGIQIAVVDEHAETGSGIAHTPTRVIRLIGDVLALAVTYYLRRIEAGREESLRSTIQTLRASVYPGILVKRARHCCLSVSELDTDDEADGKAGTIHERAENGGLAQRHRPVGEGIDEAGLEGYREQLR